MTKTLSVVLLMVIVGVVRGRPQAIRSYSELPDAGVDLRWDSDRALLGSIADTFHRSAGMQKAVLDTLRQLGEGELRLLERILPEDKPQADMAPPLEDLVDNTPQNLGGDKGSSDSAPPNDLSNSTEDQSFQQMPKISRAKAKEMRLEAIKNQIMNILWSTGFPPNMKANESAAYGFGQRVLVRSTGVKLNSSAISMPTDLYTEKIQSFYPSCGVPRNTDEDMWSNSNTMNLIFDLTLPTGQQGSHASLVAAKLRLYKLSQDNEPKVMENGPSEEVLSGPEEKKVRVTVYFYTRSLKRNRVKRRLLDSKMLPAYHDAWTEFNIRTAVRAWQNNHGRNFGLAVEVEDEDGLVLRANKVFVPMNCSEGAALLRPIPGFLMAKAVGNTNTADVSGQLIQFDTSFYPVVDLTTIETSEADQANTLIYRRLGQMNPTEHSEHVNMDDFDGHQISKQITMQTTVDKSHNK